MILSDVNGHRVEVNHGLPWFGIDDIRICRTIETNPTTVGAYDGCAFDLDRLNNYVKAKYMMDRDADENDRKELELFVLREWASRSLQTVLDNLIGI